MASKSSGSSLESANQALAMFDYPEALKAFRKAVSEEPKNPEVYFGIAEASLGIYVSGIAKKTDKISVEEIVDAYEKAIDLDPDNAYYHTTLGSFMLESGNLAGAIRHYESAVDLDPDMKPQYYTELAIGYWQVMNARFEGQDIPQEQRDNITGKVLDFLLRSVNLDKETAVKILNR